MAIEAKIGQEIYPEEICGHDFRIPSISRKYDDYHLDNLNLPLDFENFLPKIRQINPESICKEFNSTYGENINGQVQYDSDSKIITEISLNFPQVQSSRVFLEQRFGNLSGKYRSENIRDLSVAMTYQKFLSRYLTKISPHQLKYAFINKVDRQYSSINLSIPKELAESSENVANENFQASYYEKAIYITGEFSTKLNYIKYTNNGFIKLVQIDNDDCHYILDRGSYHAHNVDTAFQATTLHNIVAEFTNEIIQRRSYQE